MIILDFDGTIVDLWPRYHAVFCELSKIEMSILKYKRLKQELKRDADLFDYLNIKMPYDYFSRKAILLEDERFLKYDKLLVNRDKLIEFMKKSGSKILTARRNADNFMWQLDYLGLSEFCCSSACVNIPKIDWVKINIEEDSVIIGDDVKDLLVASIPNVSAIMVLSGLGTKNDFNKTGINYKLVTKLQDFIDEFNVN